MGDTKKTMAILAVCAAAWVIIFFRSASSDGEADRREPTIPASEVERFARQKLDELQQLSFAQSKEHCAMIYESYSGELEVTKTLAGSNDSCASLYVIEPGMLPLANIHTHGGFDTDYIGEVPSFQDMSVGVEERVDGYVSTPGGRLWFVDWQAETAAQICGEGCVSQDPDYDPCAAFNPKESYTMQQLRFGPKSRAPDC